VGGETSTDTDTDASTETDNTTDTETDAPIDTEESSETYGAAAIVLSGYGSTSLNDTVTDHETSSDVDADTSTETDSDWEAEGTVTLDEDSDEPTATESSTLTGTDSSTDTDSDQSSQTLGLAGEITGGSDQEIEHGTESGSEGTTAGGEETDTSTEDDDETDTGDSDDDSTSETGTDTSTSSGTSSDGSTESESMTDTAGVGGVITGGGQTETDSYSEGSTLSSTETDGISDSFDDTTSDEAGNDTDTGSDSGSETITETDTEPSKGTDTLTEVLGADGTIASGQESDSVSESSGDTTTETDHPTETLTNAATDSTMTLTETNKETDTDNESDQDWAVETLGASGTISGGSDCFTVNDLDTSSDTSNGSGPEDYNDTSDDPNGTATLTGSGSSSALTHQTFGDVLGVGGDISSGSLSYTVSSSDTDAATTIESGTETIADELSDGPSQTASYTVDTTMPDNATAYETGTETLGDGGTISSGSASFTWFDGNSLKRGLTVSGIAATLSVTENSTDTYGFGESGTESITTGGADAPGTVSFVWNQMGTDSYAINQGNSLSSASYAMNLTDTVSSSWHDAGADGLTGSDSVTGETDTYQWNELNSVTDNLTDTSVDTLIGGGLESFSLTDTGCETLSDDESDSGSLTLTAETDQFDLEDSLSDNSSLGRAEIETFTELCLTLTGGSSEIATDGYSLDDVGTNTLSGSSSGESNSYVIDECQYLSGTDTASGSGSNESESVSSNFVNSYNLSAEGTNSLDSEGYDQATMSYETGGFQTGGSNVSLSLTSIVVAPYQTVTDLEYTYAGNSSETLNGSGEWSASDGYSTLSTEAVEVGAGSATGNESYDGSNNYQLSANPHTGGTNTDSGNNVTGYHSVFGISVVPSETESGALDLFGYLPLGGPSPLLPEDSADVGLLSDIEDGQLAWAYSSPSFGLGNIWGADLVEVVRESGTLYLSSSRAEGGSLGTGGGGSSSSGSGGSGVPAPYVVPDSASMYLSGSALDLDVASLGAFPSGSTIGFTPNTNTATPNGLPDQEATALGNMAQNQGAPDGVSRSAPPSPTATLTALAAAGRNPTDLTLPTVGSEAVDPPGGSHEMPWWEGTKAFGASLWGSTGGAVYSIATGEAGTALGNRAVAIVENQTGQAFTGTASDYATFGRAVAGDMVGTNQIAEAGVGYDLATQQQLTTEERIQRGAAGTAAVAFTVAGGLEMASPRAVVAGETATAEVATAEVATAEVATAETAAVEAGAVEAPAARGLSCFPAGTRVATVEGLRPIESIVARQRVWAYDLIASRWQLRHVLRTYSRPCEGNAASVTVAGETIDSTSRHPYFVVRGADLEGRPRLEHLAQVPEGATTPGRWVDAVDLRVGDELLLRDGRIERIEHVRLYAFFDTVYNFEVEDLHCYAVGWSSVLVHNNNGPEGPTPYERLLRESEEALNAGDLERAVELEKQANEAATQRPTPPAETPEGGLLAAPVSRSEQLAQAAEASGYTRTNYRSHGQPVFTNGKTFITPDVDSHIGGAFKMADSVANLASKRTRMGTYDINLNRIGD
jgi:hypothetical protein